IIDPSSLGAGNAGELNIDARNLFVEGGSQLRSISSDIGNSGGIAISVGDSIVLSGMGDPDGTGSLQPSQISVATEATGDLEGTGNAGNIDIITSELRLLDGASISAESNTKGDAGSITITTSQDLTLDNASRIEASTLSGEGNLLFDVRDLVLLNGSRISTDASSNADGGNIKIDADNIVALDDSDIVANADNGAGGFIEINAVGVFGTDIREEETPESDITAVSRRDPELNGTVILNTPDLEPENNLEELPEDVIDAETLVSASPCPEGVESEFVVEGSGGIPSSPGNTLSPEGLIPNDLTEPVETLERDSESSAPSDNLNSDTIAQDLGVTPAWGWVWNDKGEILLTAHDPTVIASQRLPAHSGLCSGR
ncbi:MAG: S-layer family protein, partial [Cyanobacteria bacterium P01_E01_bin.45]